MNIQDWIEIARRNGRQNNVETFISRRQWLPDPLARLADCNRDFFWPFNLPTYNVNLLVLGSKCAFSGSHPAKAPAPTYFSILQYSNKRHALYKTRRPVVYQRRALTRVQYSSYIKKWMEYCSKRKIDPISPPVASGINFLAELYHKGLSNSALNTARSALASVIVLQGNQSFG